MEENRQQQLRDVINDAELDKAKTRAIELAAKRLRAEKELEATEKGFLPPTQDGQNAEDQTGFSSMSPGIFLQALGGWDPEQREHFLNQLAANPMLALNLSMMMNPGKAGNANPMGMMNPMAMMGQMMQPPAEPVPQIDAATMVTAMISGMQALQEMGGGNKNDNSSMDRMLDKMDEMRKETEDLKLKLIEERNAPTEQLSTEDIRRIVMDAMSGATAGKVGLLNGLQEIHAVSDELIGLGIVQKAIHGADKPSIEDRRLDHEIKMDEVKEKRDHELRVEAERAEQAAAETKGAFINGLFAAAQAPISEPETETGDKDEPTNQVKVEARPAAVIS